MLASDALTADMIARAIGARALPRVAEARNWGIEFAVDGVA